MNYAYPDDTPLSARVESEIQRMECLLAPWDYFDVRTEHLENETRYFVLGHPFLTCVRYVHDAHLYLACMGVHTHPITSEIELENLLDAQDPEMGGERLSDVDTEPE